MLLSKIMPYSLLIMSILFLTISFFIFFRKKPVIVNSNWVLAFIFLGFLPTLINTLERLTVRPNLSGIIVVIFFLLNIIWVRFFIRGYTFYGVDSTDLQEKIKDHLDEEGYDYLIGLSSIKIKNPETTLSVSIQPWAGTGMIKSNNKENSYVLKDIMESLNQTEIKTNPIVASFYLIFGILLFIFSVFMILR